MRRLDLINGVLVILLFAVVWVTWDTWASSPSVANAPPRPAVPAGRAEKRERGRRGGAEALSPAALVASIGEMDLFDPSRRAAATGSAEPVTFEAVPEVGPPPGVTFVGVRILGDDREVFVTDASQGSQQRRLRVGDEVGGYTVRAVGATRLVLLSPTGDLVTMPLTYETSGGATAATGARTMPPRPGQPSPAAGVPVRPPTATPPQARVPQLPADVRRKLRELKQRGAAARQDKMH